MTAVDWREWVGDGGLEVMGPEGLLQAIEQLEAQVAAYREDRLALIDRIWELEERVNEDCYG